MRLRFLKSKTGDTIVFANPQRLALTELYVRQDTDTQIAEAAKEKNRSKKRNRIETIFARVKITYFSPDCFRHSLAQVIGVGIYRKKKAFHKSNARQHSTNSNCGPATQCSKGEKYRALDKIFVYKIYINLIFVLYA